MSTKFLLPLILLRLCTISQLEETCLSNCRLTWTMNYANSRSCICGRGTYGLDGYPECANHSDDRIMVEMDKKYCMTFNESDNMTYIGSCPYNSLLFLNEEIAGYGKIFNNVRLPQNALELNNFVCNVSNFTERASYIRNVCGQQRRQGMLCSQCGDGLGPAILSYTHPCVECKWYGWLLYFILSFVPATILCFLIIVLRIDALSPPLNAIVIFCHVMVSHVNHMPCKFLDYATIGIGSFSPLVLVGLTIYGFFNMDFLVYVLPPFCVSEKISTLTAISLDYTVALFPLFLSAVLYILVEKHDNGCFLLRLIWSPFHKCFVHFKRSWDIKGSIINAFATLYVLSFTKIISTSVNLMLWVLVINTCGDKLWFRLYYDASCTIFHPCHYPYAFLAIVVSIIFIVLPSLFIFLHPYKIFNRCRNFQCRLLQVANEVAKVFQQSFKDGTENTLDCRWFAGIYLLIRVVIAASVTWRTSQQIQVISAFVGLMLVAIFQPHTKTRYNIIDSLFFSCLGVVFVLLPTGQSHHITQVYIFFLPLIVIIVFICWKLIATKRYVSGGCGRVTSYLRQIIKNIINKIDVATTSNNDNITQDQDQEQEPLVANNSQSKVLYTVVDINNH